MKILLIGNSIVGGGNEKINAYKDFLTSKNHEIHQIQFPEDNFLAKIWYYYQRGYALLVDHEKRHMVKTADRLERKIKNEAYEVVIGVETPWSYVLTRELDCLKIFLCESLGADELYFSNKNIDLERVRSLREMEVEIMEKSDFVIFPWKTTEDYTRKYILDGDNFSTIRHGCYPQDVCASYFFPCSIISLGNMWGQWTNKELLSYLTTESPYKIDVYGPYKPHRKYHLNYKGYASTTNVIRSYQFGLNTITKDIFRRNHFSSRILGYIAYGLPVLSPDWMQLSHELGGCIAYNESNFVELVDKYSDRTSWEKMSKAAIDQARELDWRKTLEPLEEIISKGK